MYKAISLLILVSFFVFLPKASAADEWIECRSCSSNAMQQRAEQEGSGRYYLWDLESGNIRRYSVMYEPEIRRSIAFEISVPADIREQFLNVKRGHDILLYDANYEPPYGTAYDYALDDRAQRDLAAGFIANIGFFDAIGLVASPVLLTLADKILNISSIVTFPDGSWIKFKLVTFDPFNENEMLSWEPIDGVDAAGNPIQFERPGYVGQRGFIDAETLGILGHWNTLGISIDQGDLALIQNDANSCTFHCVSRGERVECNVTCVVP